MLENGDEGLARRIGTSFSKSTANERQPDCTTVSLHHGAGQGLFECVNGLVSVFTPPLVVNGLTSPYICSPPVSFELVEFC